MRVERNYQDHIYSYDFPVLPGQATQLTIGRPREGAPPPDLDLSPDHSASRSHAVLHIDQDGSYFLEDVGSTVGTQLNDREIKGQGRVPLQAGDKACIGATVLRFDAPRGMTRSSSFGAASGETPSDLRIARALDARPPTLSLIMGSPGQSATSDTASQERLAAVYDLPLQFATQTRLSELLQLIVKRLVEMIPGATRGALVLCERSLDEVFLPGEGDAGNPETLTPQAYFPVDEPAVMSSVLARRAMSERSGFIWQRGEEDTTPFSGSIMRHGIQSGMYAPLLWQDASLGAVCVDNGAGLAVFSQDDLHLMLMVGQYAAIAVANQQLQEGMGRAWTGALEALTAALSTRDHDTQTHCYRTVELTLALACHMDVAEGDLPALARGALLHDIGKIGVSDNILFKPGPLSDPERETMQTHVRLGHDMLSHIRFFHDALPVVLRHHERPDGTGYPEGLRGDEIPLGARIFHVVDMYDALTQERPYKKAWTHEAALAEIKSLEGSQCDPEVVAALESLDPAVTARIRTLRDFSPEVRELLGRPSG